eukprot:scaffold269253_cov42-Prasinocladus_malaysianus.AAC.1
MVTISQVSLQSRYLPAQEGAVSCSNSSAGALYRCRKHKSFTFRKQTSQAIEPSKLGWWQCLGFEDGCSISTS